MALVVRPFRAADPVASKGKAGSNQDGDHHGEVDCVDHGRTPSQAGIVLQRPRFVSAASRFVPVGRVKLNAVPDGLFAASVLCRVKAWRFKSAVFIGLTGLSFYTG